MKQLPSSEYLHECFAYQDDGVLIWKQRPRHHFSSAYGYNKFLSSVAKAAGLETDGYLKVGIHYQGRKVQFFVQQIVWVMHHGQIPDGYLIDHKDTIRDNNRISNLRLATRENNAHNRKLNENSTSGVKGVYLDIATSKYAARVSLNNKQYFVGAYTTLEEATTAVQTARNDLHGKFVNHG